MIQSLRGFHVIFTTSIYIRQCILTAVGKLQSLNVKQYILWSLTIRCIDGFMAQIGF